MFFYNLDSEGRDPYALDASALRWYRMGTPGDVFPMEEELWDKYGLILPVFSAHEEGEKGDPAYPSEPVEDENGALYWYFRKDGSGLLIPGAKQALWFLDEELAPVQIEEKWAYVNRKGEIVAKAQYSPHGNRIPLWKIPTPAMRPACRTAMQLFAGMASGDC